MVTTANERYWLDGRCKGEAEGYQYNTDGTERIIPDDNPDPAKRNPRGIFDRNGGLVAMRRVNLSDDNLMFRFAAKKYLGAGPDALLPLLNSPWWMEEDRMVLLLSRARSGFGTRLVDAARTQLALPQEWSDADILVSVRIRRGIVLAAHAGPGRTVDVAGGRFTIPRGEAPHLFIDQLYIPGLGSPGGSRAAGVANASAWFDTATARSFDPNARGFNP
jgi:hypothetical protein